MHNQAQPLIHRYNTEINLKTDPKCCNNILSFDLLCNILLLQMYKTLKTSLLNA